MTTPLEIEEYKAKWEYVRHTEVLQAQHIQWYLGIVAGVVAFIYSGQSEALTDVVGGPWVSLLVLALYSLLVDLHLLLQKRNYDLYTVRLRRLEGSDSDSQSVRQKVLTVFKLQYYAVVCVGTVVVAIWLLELGGSQYLSWGLAVVYGLIMVGLSFTKLIGE